MSMTKGTYTKLKNLSSVQLTSLVRMTDQLIAEVHRHGLELSELGLADLYMFQSRISLIQMVVQVRQKRDRNAAIVRSENHNEVMVVYSCGCRAKGKVTEIQRNEFHVSGTHMFKAHDIKELSRIDDTLVVVLHNGCDGV